MADRRTHVIRLTAEGDPDTYIDMERIDKTASTQSQPDHWQKTFLRLDWGDGAERETYGPEDLLTSETVDTPDTIVEGPGPLGDANRLVTVIEVANPQDPSQIVKVGVVKRTTATEAGYGWRKTFSLFDDTQPEDGATARTSKTVRVVNNEDESNYLDAELVDTFIAIEHGDETYQKTFTHLDNKYLLDAFDLSPSDASPVVRFDPFQFPINVNWASDYLIIACSIQQQLTSASVILSNFNMPGWEGVSIEMTSETGAVYPRGTGAVGDVFVVSTKPAGAQGWKAPFNHDFIGPNFEFGSSYVAIGLSAARPNTTLQFDIHVFCSPPPGVNGGDYQPQEILYTSAVDAWGPLPSEGGDASRWPLYHYGPVTDVIFGGEVIFFSNTQGTGGLYGGPPLDNPADILKDTAEGLWGLPVGNSRWPPLISFTPISNPMPGPTFGMLIYQYLPGTEGRAPGILTCNVVFKTVRNLKKVINPPLGWGVGAYAPVLLPEKTPDIVRATSMDLAGDDIGDDPHCVIATNLDIHQATGAFPYWIDTSVPGFPTANWGDQNCILTEYLNPDEDAVARDNLGGIAVGEIPEDRNLGNPEQPAVVLDETGTFSVDLKTFAITRIA